jgi:hypothetical protein
MDPHLDKAAEKLGEKAEKIREEMREMASTDDPEILNEPVFGQIMAMLAGKIVQLLALKRNVASENKEE